MDESPVLFDAEGLPRSRRFGDVYFSREGGLAEARTVFLAGCGLPDRWSGRRQFTVAELGFGTGLNIVALLDLWRAHRPAGAHLSIFTIEADPLDAETAGRALSNWPELAPVTDVLLARWPGRRSGFHRVDLPGLSATLDLAVMDAAAALDAWTGRADAWFLDGFSPALNPDMWGEALMARVANRSAPGARGATYTVAGHVRRALAVAGFVVERRPGFGTKRERLEATALGEAPPQTPAPRVAIIGAGVAGAALARAFRALGSRPDVFEADALGAGASGNPVALVTPRLDAGLAEPAKLHAQAFDRATRLFAEIESAVIARGALQLESAPADAGRFAKIVASDIFEVGALEPLTADAVSLRLGEPAPAGLWVRDALTVEPAVVLAAWLGEARIARVASLKSTGDGWRLIDAAGEALCEVDVVCVATGGDLGALWVGAPVTPVRGQLSEARGPSSIAASWGAYLAPSRDGLVFGATHDRGQADTAPRAEDDLRNLAALSARLPRLAAGLEGARLGGRASIRAATSDFLPIAGEVAPGMFVLGGLGSRGFTLAPLLADHVAALALAAPSPLPAALARFIEPGRFVRRARRRGLVTDDDQV